MAFPRFYCPGLAVGHLRVDLPPAAAHHAARVLRLKVGDAVGLFDGCGAEALGAIVSIGRDKVRVEVLRWQTQAPAPALRLTLVQALCAQEKMDWVVQKAVELGVTRIQPVAAERSVVRLAPDRASRRREHWEGVAIAACEQCGRSHLAEVAPLRPLKAWIEEASPPSEAERRLVLTLEASSALSALEPPGSAVTILVGPEGGFTEREVRDAVGAGFQPVKLGPRVLRTETAAIAALAAIQTLWGDLR
ncbi:MAG: 16S rRNA (uracil(1498)-N(3))-methyltransferase [Azospira oryzae]|nr:MAG: 16S rRNA (uracil(1498)-N(3))-methyltransferase [Azospira oryzae]PZP82972.1 MAG: 16S rRNA (uracil(1498)-N(3))-methyltransferase [Azospira oryzae]